MFTNSEHSSTLERTERGVATTMKMKVVAAGKDTKGESASSIVNRDKHSFEFGLRHALAVMGNT